MRSPSRAHSGLLLFAFALATAASLFGAPLYAAQDSAMLNYLGSLRINDSSLPSAVNQKGSFGYILAEIFGTGMINGKIKQDYLDISGLGSKWNSSGSNIYYSSGSVGIGIANPRNKLDIRAGAYGNDQNFGISFGTPDEGSGWLGKIGIRSNVDGIPRLAIESPSDNAFGMTEGISILGNGNVGIGISAPAYRLDVSGATHILWNLTVDGVINSVIASSINASNISAGTFWLNTGGGDFSFSGNVGIGISAPTERLEIAGNILLGGTGATYRLRNVADPLEDTDVATKGYTDTVVENRLPSGAIALFEDPNGRDGWTYIGDAYQRIQDWNISRANMPAARYYHTTTVANGKIYVMGGYSTTAQSNNYEYNPSTNTWATKAAIPAARVGHSAATVNGKIYVMGGGNGTTFATTNYEYNPVTNTWATKAAVPGTKNAGSAATVNGKIYLIGGDNNAMDTNTYEYDPLANTWTTKATVPGSKYDFKAVAVNGKIYALGGPIWGTTNYEYDPLANTWTTKASIPAPETRMDSPGVATTNGKIYVMGWGGQYNSLSSNYEYNPVTNSWETKASISIARAALSAVAHNGKIYLMGWIDSAATNYNLNEAYDPATDSWDPKPLPVAKYGHCTETVNGKIYAIGGYTTVGVATTDEFDPSTNTWTSKAAMPLAKYYHGCATVDNKIYAIGGYTTAASITNYEYDPALNTWTTKTNMTTAKYQFATVAANNKIYAMGGRDASTHVATNYEYDPALNTWTTKTAMPNSRNFANGALFGSSIYVIGGSYYDSASSTWIVTNITQEYDINTNSWNNTHATLPAPTNQHAVCTIGERIYVFGGNQTTTSASVPTIYEYDPRADVYTTIGRMPTAKRLFGNGVVLGNTFYAVWGYTTAVANFNESVSIRPYYHYRKD